MNLRDATRILTPYLPAGAVGPESVRRAFAEAVRVHHPDTRTTISTPGGVWFPSMKEIKDARDVLLAHYTGRVPDSAKVCPVCRGTGVQTIGVRRVPCVRGCPDE